MKTFEELNTERMNMLSGQLRDKSIEHPNMPKSEIMTAMSLAHIAILYAKIELLEGKLENQNER